MRCFPTLLGTCLLALLVVPLGANARPAESAARCSAPAAGWKGETTGRRIKPTHPAVERRVILLVNRFRRTHGLRPLKLDPGLRYAARARGVIDERLTPRLALYSPSGCIAESVVRADGLSRASGIVRRWRHEGASRHVLLLPWVRRIGVGVRVGTFKGARVTIATADFSATRPMTAGQATAAATAGKASRPAKAKAKTKAPTPVQSVIAPPPVPVTTPPVAPPVPTGPVVGVPYTCNGPVNGVRVVGTGSDARALVDLAAGCTGTISFDIHVTSGGGDGVKVQGGVHDLTVGPSSIVCDRLTDTTFHQDGVQVQGGTNVTFDGLRIVCPYVTGQGAAGFYIDGKDFGGISNVVCDGCNLEHLHYGAMFTGPAPGSGVRNSIIHQGALTGGYFDLMGDIASALDSNNTLAPPCDGTAVPC
ncbi:MAG TPA: CAP domain-containing protein [Gaiellales bacterium]